MDYKSIENIFRNSSDPDELFDTFNFAIHANIKDADLYKILLGNPALSEDELCMYIEKISSVIPKASFDIFLWGAELFGIRSYKTESIEKALQFCARAVKENPASVLPYEQAISLYNYELNTYINKQIIDFIESGIEAVKRKSGLYKLLVNHYKKLGDYLKERKYELLAQKAAKEENN